MWATCKSIWSSELVFGAVWTAGSEVTSYMVGREIGSGAVIRYECQKTIRIEHAAEKNILNPKDKTLESL